MLITVNACQCDVCGHIWIKPAALPKQCAKCKTRQWNTSTNKAESAPTTQVKTSPIVYEVSKEIAPEPVTTSQMNVSSLIPGVPIVTGLIRASHSPRTCRVYRCMQCAAAKS